MYKIKLYCFEICPYCERAKALLTSLNLQYEVQVVTREEVSELSKKTNMMTVPQIFINDELIGGFDQLASLHSEGKLLQMIGEEDA